MDAVMEHFHTDKKQDTHVLWREFWYSQSEDIYHQLIHCYTPFAQKIAGTIYRRIGTREVDYSDFEQLALTGLIESIPRYKAFSQASFETFSGYRIKGTILSGVNQYNESGSYYQYQQELKKERRRSVISGKSTGRLDAMIDITLELAIIHLLEQERDRLSYNSVFSETDANSDLQKMLALLSKQEQQVFSLHYILDVSFADIAKEMNISRARVSQVHGRGMKKLKDIYLQESPVGL